MSRRIDLMALIYNSTLSPEEIAAGKTTSSASTAESSQMAQDGFYRVGAVRDNGSESDHLKVPMDRDELAAKWADEDMLDSLKGLFISGPVGGEDVDAEGQAYEEEGEGFEDLEGDEDGEDGGDVPYVGVKPEGKSNGSGAGTDHASAREAALAKKKAALAAKFDETYSDSDDDDKKRSRASTSTMMVTTMHSRRRRGTRSSKSSRFCRPRHHHHRSRKDWKKKKRNKTTTTTSMRAPGIPKFSRQT